MAIILWLNDLPLWGTVLVLIGGMVLISVAGTIVSQGLLGEQQLSLNNVIGGFKYMFLSQIYAGFIGFLLYGAYNRFDEMRSTVIEEVNILTTLDRLAHAFPAGTEEQLRNALKAYATQVVDVEWPQLRARTANASTTPAFDTLAYIYQAVEPVTAKQREVIGYSKELLAKLRDDRGLRVLRSLGSMQALLWVVTFAATAGAVALPWMFGSPNLRADAAMSALSVVLMGMVVLVIIKLGYPFSGRYGVQPTPYLAFIEDVGKRG